jgi:hypothetical protein
MGHSPFSEHQCLIMKQHYKLLEDGTRCNLVKEASENGSHVRRKNTRLFLVVDMNTIILMRLLMEDSETLGKRNVKEGQCRPETVMVRTSRVRSLQRSTASSFQLTNSSTTDTEMGA